MNKKCKRCSHFKSTKFGELKCVSIWQMAAFKARGLGFESTNGQFYRIFISSLYLLLDRKDENRNDEVCK